MTVLSPSSWLSSVASIVTVPVLWAAPAANDSVVPESVKSPASAPAPASAVTVKVNGSSGAGATSAVMVAEPPSSTASGVRRNVTRGTPSSSSIVTVCASPNAVPSTEPVTTTVSPGSAASSSTP